MTKGSGHRLYSLPSVHTTGCWRKTQRVRSHSIDRETGKELKELSAGEQRNENGLKEENKEMRQFYLFQQPQEEN